MIIGRLPILLILLVTLVSAEDAYVTISTRTSAEADELTTEFVSSSETGPKIGALEATMSRVVDTNGADFTVSATSVPVMAKVQDIRFNDADNSWTLEYSIMKFDPDDILNRFHRIVYFTKKDSARSIVSGDLENACLQRNSNDDCLDELNNFYVVRHSASLENDIFQPPSTDSSIIIVKTEEPYSQKEKLTITIPHDKIRNRIGTETTFQHPTKGPQVSHKFGIGILFVPSKSTTRVIMFDVIQLTETTSQLLQMRQDTRYSIAHYVTFFTTTATIGNEEVTLANIEFAVDEGHTKLELEATINGNRVQSQQCEDAQSTINTLQHPSCLTAYKLCDVNIFSQGGSLWVSVVYPIDPDSSGQVNVDLLLQTSYMPTMGPEKVTIDTLNLQTKQKPSTMCLDAVPKSFSPVEFTKATVYRGTEVYISDTDTSFLVKNSSLSASESLLTLVIGPDKSVDGAMDYFERFTTDVIELDELYMSHALHEDTLPQTVENKIYGTGAGRSKVDLDSNLLQSCMMESDSSFVYSDQSNFQCVTTTDWQEAPLTRDKSGGDVHFVFKFSDDDHAGARLWLSNIYGSTPAAQNYVDKVINHTLSLQDDQGKNSIYFVWPVYYWPRSPIGLKDHTLISLSWSVARSPGRRLLAVENPFTFMPSPHRKRTKHPVVIRPVIDTASE